MTSPATETRYDRVAQTLTVLCVVGVLFLFKQSREQPERHHQVNFGPTAQLDRATAAHPDVKPGEEVTFNVRWRLSGPLPPGAMIAYYLGGTGAPHLVWKDTTQPVSGGAPYSAPADEGRIIEDRVTLVVPANARPGMYEVTTFVYPPAGFELPAPLGSAVHSGHRTLFGLTVRR